MAREREYRSGVPALVWFTLVSEYDAAGPTLLSPRTVELARGLQTRLAPRPGRLFCRAPQAACGSGLGRPGHPRWLGDLDQFTTSSPTGEVVTVNAEWRSAVQAAAGTARLSGFDLVATNQWVPFTFGFTLATNERVVGASLALALRATSGAATNEGLYLDDLTNSLTFASLGWQTLATGTNSTVRVLDLAGHLARLADGKLNLVVRDDVGVDWALLELQVAPILVAFTNAILPVASGAWRVDAGGHWGDAGNWTGGLVANGTNITATFGVDVTADRYVNNDAPRTLGHFTFTDANAASAGQWFITNQPVTLQASSGAPLISVTNTAATFLVGLAGTQGLTKQGDGTLVLAGANTTTGVIVVSNGTLLVNGALAAGGSVTVAGGVLGGTGVIASPVTVNAGASLSPGVSLGDLSIGNTLALAAGSTTTVEINAQNSDCDLVQGLTRIAYGGTLVVSNGVGTLVAGQGFQLFSAASASGNFSSISPAIPGPGLAWHFTPANGTLSVVGVPPPQFTQFGFGAGGAFTLAGTGPNGQSYRLLAMTNLFPPYNAWLPVTTGIFSDGVFHFSDTQATNYPRRFYRVLTP
jgi:autotransporter-associated beta strand protein